MNQPKKIPGIKNKRVRKREIQKLISHPFLKYIPKGGNIVTKNTNIQLPKEKI